MDKDELLYSDEFVEAVRDAVEQIAGDDAEMLAAISTKPTYTKWLIDAVARNLESNGDFTADEIVEMIKAEPEALDGALDEVIGDIIDELDYDE